MATSVKIKSKFTPSHSKEVTGYIRGMLRTLELCKVVDNPDVKTSIVAAAKWEIETNYKKLTSSDQLSIETVANLYGIKVTL